MFAFDRSLDPWLGLAWVAGAVGTAFLVSWLASDVARIRRAGYIALLTLATGGLTAGYLTWSRAGASFWTNQWEWGIAGGAAAGALMLIIAKRRFPPRTRHSIPVRSMAWDGIVYGTAEGLLLSVLPVAMMWQVGRSFGWPSGLAAVAALLASVALIVVHHLGYPEFRGPLMRYPVALCALLSVAYLVTASPIAPVVGHVTLHAAMLDRGVELPPHARLAGPAASRRLPATA